MKADLKLASANIEEQIQAWIGQYPRELQPRLQQEFLGFGPIQELLENPEVTEVMINDHQAIWYEEQGKVFLHKDCFSTSQRFEQFIHFLCQKLNVELTYAKPFVSQSLNTLRIHICSPQVTAQGYSLCIRKHRPTPWDLLSLSAQSWALPEQLDYLKEALKNRKNILVIGNTNSGKTSTVAALLKELPEEERVLLLEDTDELPIPNSISTKLLTWGVEQSGFYLTLQDLIKEALRMRPDRLVLGEIRGPEAKDLLMALSTGHKGSVGTLHANSAQEALLRLEMLIQLGAPQWDLSAIRKLIYFSIDSIIEVEKTKDGHRRLKNIYNLAGLESFGITLEPQFY